MASVNFNMTKNSCFGDITNCNSLNIGVVSFPTVNNICRNSFYKLTNVLLLLFLLFGSCVVSFGMKTGNEAKYKQQYDNKVQESILHAQFIAAIQTISKQNEGNGSKQVNNTLNSYKQNDGNDLKPKDNTFDQGANQVIEIIDPIDHKDITRLIRFLICMDLIYRNRFINDKDIKSSGYYYPWYLKHHIFTQPFYRGLGGTKQFSSEYNFIGCDWYFGIGNVPYVGGFFTLAFVCKPTKYLPTFLHDKVTIHIIDFKPLYCLITYFLQSEYRREDDIFSPGIVAFAISEVNKIGIFNPDYEADLILYPSLYLGLFVVQVKITEYYDISVNLFGWLLGKLVYKLLESRNKFIKHKKRFKNSL